MASLDRLTTEQKDQTIRFLLHRMGLETRGAFMAHLPIAYARLFGVDASAVTDMVTSVLGSQESK